MSAVCSVDGCDREVLARGWCGGHYQRWHRWGDVDPDRPLRTGPLPGPVLDLDVHDRTGYRAGCRCADCRSDATRGIKRYRHRGPLRRPVEEAAVHVERLRAAGMSLTAISEASGFTRRTLRRWLNREVATARQPHIDRIAAIEPPPPGIHRDTCEACGAPSLAGGRWCLPCLRVEAPALRRAS